MGLDVESDVCEKWGFEYLAELDTAKRAGQLQTLLSTLRSGTDGASAIVPMGTQVALPKHDGKATRNHRVASAAIAPLISDDPVSITTNDEVALISLGTQAVSPPREGGLGVQNCVRLPD